jgi:hypothetical protein
MQYVTKQHFDRRVGNLEKGVGELKQDIHDLAKMVAKGFADLEKRLDVRDRVETLEAKMKKVESALNVRL